MKTFFFPTFGLLAVAFFLTSTVAHGHGINHQVSTVQAKVVEITTHGGQPFANQDFEVTGPDDTAPFATGRTDHLGRVVFAPDRAGEWSIKVFSKDGHGLQTIVQVTENDLEPSSSTVGSETSAPSDRSRRIIGTAFGLAIIFAIGVVLLFVSRKRTDDAHS